MRKLFLFIAVIISLYAIAAAQDAMQFPVTQDTLDNGLTVLVVERHTAPVFAGFIAVQVGSGYERTGNIGSAHLLEHMMFKGSQSIGTSDYQAESIIMAKEDSVYEIIDKARRETPYIKLNNPDKLDGHLKYIDSLKSNLDSLAQQSSQYVIQNEFDQIYTRNGSAEFNAQTGYDLTTYFVSLPANRLDLWFNMESDRLKHPAFREFFPERDVVSEERRLSVENNSDSKMMEQLIGTAYIAHPYQIYWEWQSEENNLKRSDLDQFFKSYYIPQRIAIAVVGDVKADEVKKMAEKYFGEMPRGTNPDPIYTVEPEQPGERRVEVVYEANPAVFIAYHKTAFNDREEPSFQVIKRLLGDGRTSRLYKSLVLDQQLCLDIAADFYPGNEMGDLHQGLFIIYAYPKEGVSTVDVEKAVYAELGKLASAPVEDRELTKIKNNIDANFIWGFHSNMGLARNLAEAQSQAHDWHYLVKLRDNLKAVSPGDIMSTAKKYFTKENRTVATLIPKEKGATQ